MATIENDDFDWPPVCPICGEEEGGMMGHCTECHEAAKEGREPHPDWNNKD